MARKTSQQVKREPFQPLFLNFDYIARIKKHSPAPKSRTADPLTLAPARGETTVGSITRLTDSWLFQWYTVAMNSWSW